MGTMSSMTLTRLSLENTVGSSDWTASGAEIEVREAVRSCRVYACTRDDFKLELLLLETMTRGP